MRKHYFFKLLFVAAMLFVVSCTQDENTDIIDNNNKTEVEPDFFENDGSTNLDEEGPEEEAPVTDGDVSLKTYYHYNYNLLKPSDMKQVDVNEIKCGETKTMPLLVGSSKKKVGVVKVSNDEENLYLTVKADDYMYMKKVYFNIGAKGDIPFYSNGFPNLYKFNYKAFPYYYGGQKKATYVIPLSSINLDCFEIVAYAKVFSKRSWCYYSAFAYSKDRTQEYHYSYYSGCYYFKDWVRSFEYCISDCDDGTLSAYGFCHNEICFSENGFPAIGWVNGPINQKGNAFRLYAKVEGCDYENAIYVGTAYGFYNFDRKDIYVEYNLEDTDYVLVEGSVYIGSTSYPLNGDGEETIDPAEFPYRATGLEGVNRYQFFIENVPDDFYIIPHAVVRLAE